MRLIDRVSFFQPKLRVVSEDNGSSDGGSELMKLPLDAFSIERRRSVVHHFMAQ